MNHDPTHQDESLTRRLSATIRQLGVILCLGVAAEQAITPCSAEPRSSNARGEVAYDVIVAGGSTAALAAALAAAQEGAQTLLVEPTDWPGGQITSSGVPAVDEAWHRIVDPDTGALRIDVARIARDPRNMTPRFRDMLLATGNPGRGWVSRFCFEPAKFLEEHLEPAIKAAAPKLTVLRNAVVKDVQYDTVERKIQSLTIIQRFPREGIAYRGYDLLPSSDLPEWYDPSPSARFEKQTVQVVGRNDASVFIDATEWGELLVLAEAPYLQGLETRAEDGTIRGNDQCGQAIVFGLVQQLHAEPQAATERPSAAKRQAATGHLGWGMYHDRADRWEKIWTYRRIRASQQATSAGDLSLQNWGYSKRLGHGGNDYPFGYLFLAKEDAAASRADWQGGVDLKVMAAAERRALAWHGWLRDHAPPHIDPLQITLACGVLGTGHGLSMLPYIRDTRRSIGIDGFVLDFHDLTGPPGAKTGRRFADRIALGAYPADVHPLAICDYPPKMSQAHETLPFTIPFRALTNDAYDNFLVAGKTMAQDFLANSATRLHPIEWSTGTAAGVAAAWMSRNGCTSREAWVTIDAVQDRVQRQTPIDWILPE